MMRRTKIKGNTARLKCEELAGTWSPDSNQATAITQFGPERNHERTIVRA
jgi:hypothetical protein